jgi:hypothetical protein
LGEEMSYDKEYYRKYREKNKEKIALKNKLWRKNNPEKEKARLQRQNHPVECLKEGGKVMTERKEKPARKVFCGLNHVTGKPEYYWTREDENDD